MRHGDGGVSDDGWYVCIRAPAGQHSEPGLAKTAPWVARPFRYGPAIRVAVRKTVEGIGGAGWFLRRSFS